MFMYSIPEDDFDAGINHSMLQQDLNRITTISRDKKNLHYYTDTHSIIREY